MLKKILFITTIIAIILVPVLSQAQDNLEEYKERFLEQWDKIHNATNDLGVGYFSPEGAPYHSIETLMVEAPDYGHETTSEAYSYWIYLESVYGKLTGDWSYLQDAWDTLEDQIIPSVQTNAGSYNPSDPATYASEYPHPSDYPSELVSSVPVGQDPISSELTSTYGSSEVYGMHWLMDCDNFYGYSNGGSDSTPPIFINTFQRGEQESCWETVPHPCIEEFEHGGPNGFLDLFTGDASYAQQWKYTNAPDADARAIQAIYWAAKWAEEQGLNPASVLPIEEAKKMGDYLRLSMFDKYFKPIGCESVNAQGATGRNSCHYLLSWYYAWGGSASTSSAWAWRIGCSHSHFGYQNPVAAWVLSTDSDFIPDSSTAQSDWETSLERQVELYRWLQSDEGAIAGGCTNSWNGAYEAYPSGQATFYDMAYLENPVYHDPGSNTWFGMQAWSVERLCEYYYLTNDSLAKEVLDKWVGWVKDIVTFDNGIYQIPSTLSWSGQPDTWNASNPGDNSNLHVTVVNYSQDVGIAACLAKALSYYAAGTFKWEGTMDTDARDLAKDILDSQYTNFEDELGVALEEPRADFVRFFEPPNADDAIYIPSGWSGTMPNGDVIQPGIQFIDIRSGYENDPMYDDLVTAVNSGQDFTATYHRLWAQIDVALANAAYYELFQGTNPDNDPPTVSLTAPSAGSEFDITDSITISATASDSDGTVSTVEFYANGTKIGSDSTSPYSMVWSPSAVGNYSITAKATDNEGASTTSTAVSITVTSSGTNIPPTISITSPSDGAEYDVNETVSISASASDSDGSVTVVEFYVDGTKIGEDTSSPYSITWSGSTEGDYTITAIATDNEGATASDSVTITLVDNGTQGDLEVTYTIVNDWGNGFQAEVTVTNNSGASIQGWEVNFTFSGNQSIINGWCGTFSQSGQSVSITDAGWNGSLGNGQSATVGFVANYSGSNSVPSNITATAE